MPLNLCEHLGISQHTGKKVKININKLTAIQEHLLVCSYSLSFEEFAILTTESNNFTLKMLESILIGCGNKQSRYAKTSRVILTIYFLVVIILFLLHHMALV